MRTVVIRFFIIFGSIGIFSGSLWATEQTAVFAGGCFWGVEAVFEHVKGVKSVVSGYSGGTKETANYETVSSGKTDHAESVMIKFDSDKITYQQLLFIFFSVAHDPTQLNEQGPDHGHQYRSVIFYTTDEQHQQALAFIKAIEDSKAISKPVVTEVVPFKAFYKAEDEHQDFVRNNPDYPYVVYNDLPKLKALKKKFPDLYVGN
ncbi:MAG TPA: peptide-methionine (S)-S-oxide reductase MsrA [Pyrinomonadaceae bacterium]|nr:peptide-methionine (S)-S-oxide reductase MsrA [Pyrinomonadaceae bacterium]